MQLEFNNKWRFFPFIYKACNGDMTMMKVVVLENLYDFLMWVDYEIDEVNLKREYQKEAEWKNKTSR